MIVRCDISDIRRLINKNPFSLVYSFNYKFSVKGTSKIELDIHYHKPSKVVIKYMGTTHSRSVHLLVKKEYSNDIVLDLTTEQARYLLFNIKHIAYSKDFKWINKYSAIKKFVDVYVGKLLNDYYNTSCDIKMNGGVKNDV